MREASPGGWRSPDTACIPCEPPYLPHGSATPTHASREEAARGLSSARSETALVRSPAATFLWARPALRLPSQRLQERYTPTGRSGSLRSSDARHLGGDLFGETPVGPRHQNRPVDQLEHQ